MGQDTRLVGSLKRSLRGRFEGVRVGEGKGVPECRARNT